MVDKLVNNKAKTYIGYGILFLLNFLFIFLFVKTTGVNDFLTDMENRSFDLRQSLLVKAGVKKPNKDIVVLTIDDASYEYLLNNYGEWPIPREVYANLINYVEKQKPQAIVFDLMFVKSLKSKSNADAALVKAITENKNVYTSMNFDNQAFDVRQPVKLPEHLSINVKNDSKIDLKTNLTDTNCRSILPQILQGTKNVGIINVTRSEDGILRKLPPFMIYQNNFYPHLGLLVGLNYLKNSENLNIKNFTINKQSQIKLGTRTIPLDKDGGVILNWYGEDGKSFKEIPFYKVLKAMKRDKGAQHFDFKNKIIYIGTTAVSLYDVKSIPVDSNYPGVEMHATFVNNLIDNNFIRKVPISVNLLISLALMILIGFIVFKTGSTFIALSSTVLISFCYIILTYYLMEFFNLWIAIILPITFILLTFVASYIVKYVLKSRDFEHQYKLATTDGLTELYNHRYFQEQMIMQVANSKRYDSKFSLILIDIDFFKKFNDNFGHQSGDAVLRQVAQRLKKNVRSTDFVCRYGGEEMSIILPNADKDEAIITAQKLCQVISEKPFKLANNQESKVTISLGVATFPLDGSTADEIIAMSDKRLYVAKENGRNQVGS